MAYRDAGNSLFQTIIVIASLAAAQGCSTQAVCDVPSSIPEGTAAPWDSPALTRIKKQWESLFDPKEEWGDERSSMLHTLNDVFRNNLSEKDLRKLAASADSLPLKSPNGWQFVDYLISYMIANFVHSGDRESLVKLLAARCPDQMSPYVDTDYFIADFGQDKLKDPILVLAEAFQKCKEPSVRHKIVAALRRAFAGHGLHWTGDADFVKKCSAWYAENRDRILVNRAYGINARIMPPYEFELLPKLYEPQVTQGSKREFLFKLKPLSEIHANAADVPLNVLPKDSGTTAVATNTVPSSNPSGKKADNRLAGLQGTWNLIEEISWEGRVPDDKLKGEQYIVSNDVMRDVSRYGLMDEYRITVCPESEPHMINLRTGDKKNPKWQWTVFGIYKLDGDTLQMCLAPSFGGPRPTEFKAGMPWAERLLTLKRVK